MGYVIVNGERYDEPESVTLGEARDIKRISGYPLDEWGDMVKRGDPDALAALLYVVMRRKNPAVTEDDVNAIDAMSVGGGDDDDPPTEGAGEDTG